MQSLGVELNLRDCFGIYWYVKPSCQPGPAAKSGTPHQQWEQDDDKSQLGWWNAEQAGAKREELGDDR